MIKKLLSVIFVIFIVILCLSISIEFNAYNKSYYMKSYKNNNIEKITGRSENELSIITDTLIGYIKGNKSSNELYKHFNDKEVTHMEDVLNLFNLLRKLKWISIIGIILLTYIFISLNKGYVIKNIIKYGITSIYIFIIFFAFIVSTNFNKYFTLFHLLLFTNDLWLLNPKTDLMIQMLPEVFFSKMALNISITFISILLFVQIAFIIIYKKARLVGELKLKRY